MADRNEASSAKRLAPTAVTVRRLLIASAGVCAMPGCNKRLIAESSGWIGTISAIVAAEDKGPRADAAMPPEERRRFDNLVLLCADHGREVDDAVSGEVNFPTLQMREIKRAHEQRITDLVNQVIDSATVRPRIVDDVLDRSSRSAVRGETPAAFLTYLQITEEYLNEDELRESAAAVQQELAASRVQLTRLSEAALGVLAALLGLWESALGHSTDGERLFDNDFAGTLSAREALIPVHESLLQNRALSRTGLSQALSELVTRSFLYLPDPEEYEDDHRTYGIRSPWTDEFTTWRRIAEYLWGAQGVNLSDWVRQLDYRIFDNPSPGREIPIWR